MEDLDILKAHWKSEKAFQKIPRSELYEMSHKSSSSVVRWILLISIAEFLLWLTIPVISGKEQDDDKGVQLISSLGMDNFMDIMSYLNYTVIVLFVIIFYFNYKKVKVTDNSKNLMANILRVRKTVTYYINIVLSLVVLRGGVLMYVYLSQDTQMAQVFKKAEQNGKLYIMIIVACLLSFAALALIVFVVHLYYRIIYGFLLRKLSRNYEDLKKNNSM